MKNIHLLLDSDQTYLQKLAEKIREKDSNAFAAFYGKTYAKLYHFFYQRTGDVYQAQDLLKRFYILAYHEMVKEVPAHPKKALHKWQESVASFVPQREMKTDMRPFREMKSDTAELLMLSILDEIGMQENTIPLEVVRTYDEYHEQRFTLERFLAMIIVALMLFVAMLLY